MEYGSMLRNSFNYAVNGLWGNWGKWLLLFISMIIFPLWGGYQWKIYKGESQLPRLENWVEMFINGIKLIVVGIVYGIIPWIILMVLGGAGALMGGAMKSPDAGALIGIIIGFIIAFIFSLIALMALIRFARTDSFGEAFNISAIVAHIGKIGWVSYILALIILWVVAVVALFVFIIAATIAALILALIPLVGWLLGLLLMAIIGILIGPFVGVFEARYFTLIYDSAAAPA
ncbi:MAG TPA: DUF4013 domain-containing protein [Anaerolineaceae bacterium]|jgi:hypothetical protein|uniref:DUF4013 domain-containing protein n=1 Tax=Methanoculleus sp. TaxID=90427 RepID=UPI001B66D938|nr:DUF4013 domain-containing protein [Methanoculleus sp.]MBP7144779.1 DUF4013 domain-containing protein [Methanoculleus sp.]HNT07065.1 DUF4013 domain-containing protein [Methanoculleus sp.]HOR78807.1 DUF4013 domain-containing protein [Anaerolineaceae bacterium]